MDNETTGGDHEGHASPREGAREPAHRMIPSRPEVIEVTPRKIVAVITPKLVCKIERDTQGVHDMSAE